MALGGAGSARPGGGPGPEARPSGLDGPISVLLVEDDDADAFLVSELLAGWIALAGALGIAVWTESRWSAVLVHAGFFSV